MSSRYHLSGLPQETSASRWPPVGRRDASGHRAVPQRMPVDGVNQIQVSADRSGMPRIARGVAPRIARCHPVMHEDDMKG